ncbi:MAG: nucleotide exchange factor GrpE [Ignavibacteriae bacterium]|nr:nucleotide exchange factor GrpE [Ignavibacteriota bacterium]
MKKDKNKHKEKTKEKEIEIKDETDLDEIIEEIKEEEEEKVEENSVEKLEGTVQELKDTLLRKAAEFENYKRRTENDQLNLKKYAAESFILKILPVYDDLQRSIDHLDESNLESIKDGLKLVFGKFTKTFEEQGIKKIEAQGEAFDVEFHEALLQQPSADVEPNTVIQEVEAGYMYKDKVIKHSKVVVSQEVEEPAEENKDKEE